MDDLTKCTSFAMNGNDFCYRHNPEISEEEKLNASSLGGKSNSHPEFIETPLPEMKIERYQDIVSVLADTINNVRTGKISQKSGSTIGYLSFIMLMAVDKAKAEAKEEKIEKLKAEGKWQPEPAYDRKHYMYKDEFYLDKDGNKLVLENEDEEYVPEIESPFVKGVSAGKTDRGCNKRKHKNQDKTFKKLTKEEHFKLMDDPNYHNYEPQNNVNEKKEDEYSKMTDELINTLKNSEIINSI